MTIERINQLEEQIKTLIHRGILHHEEMSKPLHRAKAILELLTQVDIEDIKQTTRHEVLAMAEEFVAESVELGTNEHGYLLSVNATN